jgi:hypothetical protein
LLIYAEVRGIDGGGNILAQAGPCLQDYYGRIRFGVMLFDAADVTTMVAKGIFEKVVRFVL